MADDKLPTLPTLLPCPFCGGPAVSMYKLHGGGLEHTCGNAANSDCAGHLFYASTEQWNTRAMSPAPGALRDAVQFAIDWISGLSPSRGTSLEDRMSAKKTLQAALGQAAGTRGDVTEAQLEAAVTAASEHIAPCGHNELGAVFDAVIVAFRSIGLRVGDAAQREPGGRR